MKLLESKHYIRYIFLIIILITLAPISAQHKELRFSHLTVDDGLSQTSVLSMLKDTRGFIWIGTIDGLNRYDGYIFKTFVYDKDNPYGISSNNIQVLRMDSSGIIWIGTYKGLNRFDPKTEQFTAYLNDSDNPNSLSNNVINDILIDHKGEIWLGTEYGLNTFSPKRQTFTRFLKKPNDPNSISNNNVTSLCQDSKGILWIGTNGGGFSRFDREKKQFICFQNNPKIANSLSNDHVTSLCEDKEGYLWIGTYGGGVNRFDPKNDQFTRYKKIPGDTTSISDNFINTIFEDCKGVLWIGTENEGILTFDRDKENFYSYKNIPGISYSLSNYNVMSIYEINPDELWIGTYDGGVNIYNKQALNFTHYNDKPHESIYLSNNMVWGMYEDSQGFLWVGSNGGLDRFNRRQNRVKRFHHDPNDPNSLSHNRVYLVHEDRLGNFWVGTLKGLNKLNRKTGKCLRYLHNPKDPFTISNDAVISMCQDYTGTFWIGTKSGGLNTFDYKTERFTRYVYDRDDPNSLPHNRVNTLYEDRMKNFWIGTNGGMSRFEKKENHFIHYQSDPGNPQSISNNSVYAIHEDREGNFWIGTKDGGLNKFDRTAETFKHYTKKNGLVDNTIYGILEDNKGNLWLTTNRGVSCFHPKTEECTNYDARNGLQNNEFNQLSHHKSKKGEIFFGGINGFNAFFPDSIKKNPFIPPIVITDFQLFNKSVPLGKMDDGRTLLAQSITETKELSLSYKDNVFSFAFAALNYITPKKNQYSYMMEGFDKEWNHIGNRRFVTYTAIKPGNYTFKVMGSNNDGLWNEQSAQLNITITPPFWQTWWFRVFITLFMVSVVFFIFKASITYVKEVSEKKMLSEELKLKANFTAMLVHDLRSPLSGILGYSEILMEDHINEKTRTAYTTIYSSTEAMIKTINDMLDVYKFEANKIILEKEEFLLGDVITEIEMLMTPLCKQAAVSIAKNIAVSVPIQADINRIRRVVNNLIANALKFSPKEGTITARVKRVKIKNEWYQELSILDDGPGIPDEKQQHLFNAYTQLEDKHGKLPVGTGLGLAVSKLIIETHGGTIAYRPGEKGGSEFYFRLPEV